MTPSLEQELHLALLAASHGRIPRGLERLATRFRVEARREAASILADAASILDRHHTALLNQGTWSSAPPLSHGDVAGALRLAADPDHE